jgi:hypothetical protein
MISSSTPIVYRRPWSPFHRAQAGSPRLAPLSRSTTGGVVQRVSSGAAAMLTSGSPLSWGQRRARAASTWQFQDWSASADGGVSAACSSRVSSSDNDVLITVPPYCWSAAMALSGVTCSITMNNAEVPGFR